MIRNELSVSEQVTIQAAPAAVWDQLKNFDSLHAWHPAFAADEIVEGTNNQPGAVRKLTLKDGPSLTEELLSYDDAGLAMSYRILESPLPIDGYVSSMRVAPGSADGTSVVVWESTFKRKNPEPKPDETDEAVTELVSGVYTAGLDNLKEIVEAQ